MPHTRACSVALVAAVFLISMPVTVEAEDGEHTSFHLSFGAGGTWSTTTASVDGADEDAIITGAGIGGMLLIGYALSPGLNIGGGSMGGHNFAPTVELAGEEADSDGDLVLNVLGPYVDYYIDARRGLHVLALAGVATLEDGDDDTDGVALGFGGVVGAGWDWRVARSWSVGALARLHVLSTNHEIDAAGTKADVSYLTIMPALLITATYQ